MISATVSFEILFERRNYFILADYRGGGSHPYQASPQQGMYVQFVHDSTNRCQRLSAGLSVYKKIK